MSRGSAPKLPEAFDLFHRHRELLKNLPVLINLPHLREMKHRVEQHGSMAIREHEPVAVHPCGICGVVAKEFLPKAVGHRSQSHGRARMARVRLLNSING